MRVLLIGPPGAGKGTQASRIADHFDLARIATGDLLREQVANGTELGKVAKEYMDRGDLVPDELVIAMVMERLASSDCDAGFVLDGFPRTVNQAEALDRRLVDLGAPLHAVLCFEAAEEELLRRLAGRVPVQCQQPHRLGIDHGTAKAASTPRILSGMSLPFGDRPNVRALRRGHHPRGAA